MTPRGGVRVARQSGMSGSLAATRTPQPVRCDDDCDDVRPRHRRRRQHGDGARRRSARRRHRAGGTPRHLRGALDRREQLVDLLPGVHISEAVPSCAAAVLAVKPADVPDAAVAAVTAGARRLLSIAAGVPTRQIELAVAGLAADAVAVIRAMPNTPALVGEGASAISGGSAATNDDLDWAEAILGGVGLVVRVAEDDLDAVTGLSGSGPAYVFLVAEALVDAAVDAGLSPRAGIDVDDAAAGRLGEAARRARRPGSPAGDGHVARRHDGRRTAGPRGARRARRIRRGRPGGDAAEPRALARSVTRPAFRSASA